MIPEFLNQFDSLLSLFAVIGIWPAIHRLVRANGLSPVEQCLKWILIFLTGMLLSRIPYVGFHIAEFGPFVYIFAILSLFTTFLYVENLMRIHMPKPVKILIALIGFVLLCEATLNVLPGNRTHLIIFGLYFCLAVGITISVILLRNKSDHSRSENMLLDLTVGILIFMPPLMLTDITSYGISNLPRMGVVGILLLTYFSLYNQSLFFDKGFLIKKLGKSLLFSLILTLAMSILLHQKDNVTEIEWRLDIDGRILVLFFVMNLIYRIHFAVKMLDGDDEFYHFVQAICESKKTNPTQFLKGLNEFFVNLDQKTLSQNDLNQYDIQNIGNLFEKTGTYFFCLHDLRSMLAEVKTQDRFNSAEIECFEQIIDILERFDMTYISRFSASPAVFVLFNVPMVNYRRVIDLKTRLIGEIAMLANQKSK